MAKRRLLRALLWILSLPYIGASLLLEALSPKGLRADLNRCLALVARHGASVPSVFVEALVLAEDHRSQLHPGVDVIAMIRALWVRATSGQIQGASTIEQQYVRVVSNRYERTMVRKLREQLLALMLARRADKEAIASAYLAIAFYGTGSIGIDALRARFGEDFPKVSLREALMVVAQLRHPRPLQPSEAWQSKISARLDLLFSRVERTVNKALPTTAKATVATVEFRHCTTAPCPVETTQSGNIS